MKWQAVGRGEPETNLHPAVVGPSVAQFTLQVFLAPLNYRIRRLPTVATQARQERIVSETTVHHEGAIDLLLDQRHRVQVVDGPVPSTFLVQNALALRAQGDLYQSPLIVTDQGGFHVP